MGRSRKKAVSQRVVDVATTGLPSPIRKFLGGRIVALLIVAGFPILYATGVISIDWENGRPRLSINQERAEEVKEQAAQRLDELRDEHGGNSGLTRLVAPDSGAPLLHQAEAFEERVAERIGQLPESLPVFQPQNQPHQQTNSPLSGFQQQFNRR